MVKLSRPNLSIINTLVESSPLNYVETKPFRLGVLENLCGFNSLLCFCCREINGYGYMEENMFYRLKVLCVSDCVVTT